MNAEIKPTRRLPDTPHATVALAPFQDDDGRRTGNWVERGLMSLLAQALEAEPRLALTPVTDTLKATRLAGWLPVTHRPGAIASAVRADWVVDACIDTTPEGLFIRSWVYDADAQASSVQCRQCAAVDDLLPTLLQMIQAPMARVWPPADGGAPEPARAAPSAHGRAHFGAEVAVRAQAALARQDWRLGLPLVRMAAHLNPADLDAQLRLLAALSELGDRSVPQLIKSLQRHRGAGQHEDLAARLSLESGSHDLGNGRPRRAAQHLARTLAAPAAMSPAHTPRACLLRARAAWLQGDLATARAALQQMGEAQDLHRPNHEVVAQLVLSAQMHLELGELETAQGELTEAIGRSRMADLQGHLADGLRTQALLHFAAGTIEPALEAARASLALALQHGDPPRLAAASEALGLMLRERGLVHELRGLLQRVDGMGDSPNDLGDATRRLLAAHLLSAEGKTEAAAEGYLAYLHFCECADLWLAYRQVWPCAALELLKAQRQNELPGLMATLREVQRTRLAPALARGTEGVLAHVQGCAALSAGDTRQAAAWLGEAMAQLENGWVLSRAREAAARLPAAPSLPIANPGSVRAWAAVPGHAGGLKTTRLRRTREPARPVARPTG